MSHARCLRAAAALVLLGSLATAADVSPPTDPKAFDKIVVDTLRDVHNKGADLYNTAKDYPGTFRLYEGSLLTVRPLLAHRAAAQKFIDDGFAAADKEADPARRAFVLHEAIEKVRAHLKTVAAANPVPTPPKVESPKPKVETPKPVIDTPKPKVETPKPKAPEPTPMPKVETPKPKSPTAVPMPKVETPKIKEPMPVPMPKPKVEPPKATTGGLGGKVTLGGKPVPSADVLLVSLTLPKPRVFNAVAKDNGTFTVAEPVPPGKYVVIVTGRGVPAKYGTTTTSGLTIDVKPGATADIALK